MLVLTVTDKLSEIRSLLDQFGHSPIPKTVIEESIGKEAFVDLVGLRYIRKAGYISPQGTISARRTSTRDVVVYEPTTSGKQALALSSFMEACSHFEKSTYSCKGEKVSMKKCRQCFARSVQVSQVAMRPVRLFSAILMVHLIIFQYSDLFCA